MSAESAGKADRQYSYRQERQQTTLDTHSRSFAPFAPTTPVALSPASGPTASRTLRLIAVTPCSLRVPTPSTPTSTLRRRGKSGETLSRPFDGAAEAMKPEKNGGACGEGVPCSDSRRETETLGDSLPDALRGCDDDLAELGRCAAGDPGVLGRRPGATVTVLGAIDGRFCDEVNGETNVIAPLPAPRLAQAVPLDPALVLPPADPPLVVLAGDSGAEPSSWPGVAAGTSELRRTPDSRGNAGEEGLIVVD